MRNPIQFQCRPAAAPGKDGEARVKIFYYAVLLDEEASVDAPDAIFRSTEDGVRLERLDREDGRWIDDPALFDFLRGEPGAEPIDEEQARRIVRRWGLEGPY